MLPEMGAIVHSVTPCELAERYTRKYISQVTISISSCKVVVRSFQTQLQATLYTIEQSRQGD